MKRPQPVLSTNRTSLYITMLTRREFLTASSLVATGAMISPRVFAEKAPEHWARYRRSLVIDGQSGCGVFYLQDDDPALPGELQAIRDSGVTGLIASPAPQGRFWL